MPHFDENGRDTVLCQVCLKVQPLTTGHEVTWMQPIPGKAYNGNVCNACLDRLVFIDVRTTLAATGHRDINELRSAFVMANSADANAAAIRPLIKKGIEALDASPWRDELTKCQLVELLKRIS